MIYTSVSPCGQFESGMCARCREERLNEKKKGRKAIVWGLWVIKSSRNVYAYKQSGPFPLRSAGCREMDRSVSSAYEVRRTAKQIIQLA